MEPTIWEMNVIYGILNAYFGIMNRIFVVRRIRSIWNGAAGRLTHNIF
jgi:hypothetical protein